jgi:hypothetical protein
MPYPRLLKLSTEREEALKQYLDTELENHYAERGPSIDNIIRWQKDYWAEPTTKVATFPFHNAATIIIPLSAIAIEAIHARVMTTLPFNSDQFVAARSVSADWEPATQPFEKLFNKELLEHIGVKRPLNDCFLEAEKYGTMVGKSGYERSVKTAVRSVGEIEEEFDVVVKQGATLDYIPVAGFIMPHYARDPQTAPWCGEEHDRTPYECEMLEKGGMFYEGTFTDGPDETIVGDDGSSTVRSGTSRIKSWLLSQQPATTEATSQGRSRFDTSQDKLEKTEAVWPKSIKWKEIWLAWNVDGGKTHKEIMVHYHKDSGTFLAIRYNWYSDLKRPYRTGVYFPVEGRWRGIGICKMNEQFQREITTQHRQRLDNATLANIRMFKIHKMSGYGPGEPIFPGKLWFLDDVQQMDVIQMGEVYPSAYNNEAATKMYYQERIGVNEANLGMPQVGTPGTATSDIARIQEGATKFTFIFDNFRDFVNRLTLDVASNIQQFGPRKLPYYDVAEGGHLVRQFFEMPQELIRDGLLISLKVATHQQNKVLDRQNWMQISQFLQQYYTGMFQLAQMTGNPQLMQIIIQRGLMGGTEAARQFLETYDTRNIDRIVLVEIERMFAQQQPGGGNGGGLIGNRPNGGGSAGATGTEQNPAMALLAEIVRASRGNGAARTATVGG